MEMKLRMVPGMEGGAAEVQAEAKEKPKLEVGSRLEVNDDGKKYDGAVLEMGEDSLVAAYAKGGDIPQIGITEQKLEQGVEATEVAAQQAVEANAETKEVTPEAALGATIEQMEADSESAFEKAAKSKWSLAGAGSRLLGAIKGSEAASFAYDLKDMFVGKKAEMVDLGEGEAAQEIGTKGVFGTGLEAMWGAPKDMIRALGAVAAEVGNAAESEAGRMELEETAKFAKELSAYENVAEKRGFLERGAEAVATAIKSPFDIVKSVGRHVQNEMIYPVIKGNMDMLKYIQEKITETPEAPVDLASDLESMESIASSLEDNWDDLQAELADSEAELADALTKKRLEKLQQKINKLTQQKEAINLSERGQTLTERRNAIRVLNKAIEANRAKIDQELLGNVEQIINLENDQAELDEVKLLIAA